MKTLWRDLRYATRMARTRPGFTAAAVISLALGIGACTAIFSVVNGVLLRALPYPGADRIVQLKEIGEKGGQMNFTDPNFFDLQQRNKTLEAVAEYNGETTTVIGGAYPVRTPVYAVSGDFFRVMGVQPFIGRTFMAEETRVGSGSNVAVVSYGFWQRLLGGKAEIAPAGLKIDNRSFSVVGVMPPGFKFPQEAEIWIPREIYPVGESRSAHNWLAIGRLRPEVTIESARAELNAIGRQLKQEHGSQVDAVSLAAIPLQEFLVSNVRRGLMILLVAVGFLLLVACANVANMLLAQAASRQKEFAIRVALGASRLRLARQFVTESVMLTFAAGILGVILALWGIDLLRRINPGDLPRMDEIGIDLGALLFTLGLSFFVAVLIGLVPLLRFAGTDLQSRLKDAGRDQSANPVSHRLRAMLVVFQVAMTLILLVGAGLLAKSFVKLLQIDPGFHTESVMTMDLSLPFPRDEEAAQKLAQFHRQLFERIGATPGVTAVGGINGLPMTNRGSNGQFLIDNDRSKTGYAEYRVASEGYFEAMKIPLLRGRLFNPTDSPASEHAAVISQALADRAWPHEDPLGKQIQFGNMDGYRNLLRIVGIVADVREYGLDANVARTVYVSSSQRPKRTADFSIVVRSTTDPEALVPAVRRIVQSLDPELPLAFRPLEKIFTSSLDQRRFSLVIFGIFGAVALVLAITGIYGVMSYVVSERTREIGIRMAIGAQQRDVLAMVIRQGTMLATAGVVIGLLGAFGLTRLMLSLLHDVSATDLPTFALISFLLMFVAFLACYIPARRAARIEPIIALRDE